MFPDLEFIKTILNGLRSRIEKVETRTLTDKDLQNAVDGALIQAKESGKFDGAPGADGGYYTPAVKQTTENTMQVSFTPSKTAMPAVDGTEITLPDGPQGADGKSAYQYAVDGGYTGTEAEFAAKLAEEMPTTLPNPNALTFTGAVTGSYDGSAPLSVEIPQGGGGAWHTIGTQKMDGVETAVSFDLNGETIIQIIVTAHWGAALTATKATVTLTLANGGTVQFTPQTLNASSYSPKNIFTIFGNSKHCRQMIFSKSEGATYNQVQGSFGVAYGYDYVSENMVGDGIATGITITFEQAPSHDAIVKVEGM